MRHRSRSRNYDSNDNYRRGRSTAKYESSRSHKSRAIHSHYSNDSRKHDSSKVKKSSDRSRYDNHRDRDSESEDKYDKKVDSNYDRGGKKSKYSKYNRGDSPPAKHSRKYGDYTHSYRRRSISSDISARSYDSKYKKFDDKSDKDCYKSSKDVKKSKAYRSPSSDQFSDTKVKNESTKEKTKDKKLKKKSKKSDKEKEKKKRKRQKHSTDEDVGHSEPKKSHGEEKTNAKSTAKHNDDHDQDVSSKAKLKLEPFKVKENSNLKSQINFFNSPNIFTKDEWQKESSDDDQQQNQKKTEVTNTESIGMTMTVTNTTTKVKSENEESTVPKPVVSKVDTHEEIPKEADTHKKLKSEEDNDSDRERNKKRRYRSPPVKPQESGISGPSAPAATSGGIGSVGGSSVRGSKHRDTDDDRFHGKQSRDSGTRKERSHSNNKNCEGLAPKSVDRKEKPRPKTDHQKTSTKGGGDDKKKLDDVFDDERLELPRTPTDAQYTGLFARLQEEPVSDTEMEDILPPILLDDRMKALLVNDPNVSQEGWDSEEDSLTNRRENCLIAPKHRGVLETLAVPWKTLIDEASLNKNKQDEEKGPGLTKCNVANILENIGVSKQLVGDALWSKIQTQCSAVFLNPIAPIHQTLMSQKKRRNSIFCERGLFAGALSARKDLFIRRVLHEPMI